MMTVEKMMMRMEKKYVDDILMKNLKQKDHNNNDKILQYVPTFAEFVNIYLQNILVYFLSFFSTLKTLNTTNINFTKGSIVI